MLYNSLKISVSYALKFVLDLLTKHFNLVPTNSEWRWGRELFDYLSL